MQHRGYTLIEILTAMVIVGVLALFSVPALISTTAKTSGNQVGKTETLIQSFVTVVDNYEAETNNQFTPADIAAPGYISPTNLFGQYGSYLNLQQSGGVTYFLLHDGSRFTTNVNLFKQAALGYTAAASADTQWNGADLDACGNQSPLECFYYDYNGRKPPNAIGKDGDIIPLHFDATTDSVKTLYAFQLEQGAPDCKYVSSYDVYTNTQGASACP